MQLYFGELVHKGRFKYYCASVRSIVMPSFEELQQPRQPLPRSAALPALSLHNLTMMLPCLSLSGKIQCTLTNRFSLNNPLTQKSKLCTRLTVVSLNYFLPFWFSNDEAFSWKENRGAKSISGWCIAENLGRQLNTDWKLTECCSTHLRFIWKQAPNCFRDKYASGRKTWRDFKLNSSDSAATCPLYRPQNFQIQR